MRALLATADVDAARAANSRELPGVEVTVRASGSETLTWSRNVVGSLAGSDARLRNPPDAPELAAALRWAGPATGMALHLDRTDGTRGGSDYRDFARARVRFFRFFGNFFPGYHQAGDRPESLDPAQVQRMARLALAAAWRLADR